MLSATRREKRERWPHWPHCTGPTALRAELRQSSPSADLSKNIPQYSGPSVVQERTGICELTVHRELRYLLRLVIPNRSFWARQGLLGTYCTGFSVWKLSHTGGGDPTLSQCARKTILVAEIGDIEQRSNPHEVSIALYSAHHIFLHPQCARGGVPTTCARDHNAMS